MKFFRKCDSKTILFVKTVFPAGTSLESTRNAEKDNSVHAFKDWAKCTEIPP